jgi:DNA topoisomerase-1
MLIMFTTNFTRTPVTRAGSWLITINGKPASERMRKLRIPPAWTDVVVDPDPKAYCLAEGSDSVGRRCKLYDPVYLAGNSSAKFNRVKSLLAEREDIGAQIEADVNSRTIAPGIREAALAAYLIYLTGMRPGGAGDGVSQVKAYGATTLLAKHVKPFSKGIKLRFIGKKGVSQNVPVTNPYLVRLLLSRKREAWHPRARLFQTSAAKVNEYLAGLGTGQYTAKDFRTALGTKIAIELLSVRKRWPRAKSAKKRVVRQVIAAVARTLGNTPAISKKSYIDASVLAEYVPSDE